MKILTTILLMLSIFLIGGSIGQPQDGGDWLGIHDVVTHNSWHPYSHYAQPAYYTPTYRTSYYYNYNSYDPWWTSTIYSPFAFTYQYAPSYAWYYGSTNWYYSNSYLIGGGVAFR